MTKTQKTNDVAARETGLALLVFALVAPLIWLILGYVDERIPLVHMRYVVTEYRWLVAPAAGALAALTAWSRLSGYRHALGNHLSGRNRSGKKRG